MLTRNYMSFWRGFSEWVDTHPHEGTIRTLVCMSRILSTTCWCSVWLRSCSTRFRQATIASRYIHSHLPFLHCSTKSFFIRKIEEREEVRTSNLFSSSLQATTSLSLYILDVNVRSSRALARIYYIFGKIRRTMCYIFFCSVLRRSVKITVLGPICSHRMWRDERERQGRKERKTIGFFSLNFLRANKRFESSRIVQEILDTNYCRFLKYLYKGIVLSHLCFYFLAQHDREQLSDFDSFGTCVSIFR